MITFCTDANENRVLNTLLHLGKTSINDMQHYITTTYHTSISKTHLYNIINALINHNIVQKHKTQYQFHPSRIQQQQKVADTLHYCSKQQQSEIYPTMYKPIHFDRFTDTNKLRSYYVSLLLSITGAKTRYKYAPHYSYVLSRLRQSEDQPKYYYNPEIISYEYCGSNTRLDQYTSKFMPTQIHYTTIPRCPRFHGYAAYIIGEYIIEIHISEFLRDSLEHFYTTVQREEDFDHDFFVSLFKIKSEGKFIIRHDPDGAKKWMKYLQ